MAGNCWHCGVVWLVFMGQTLSTTRGISPREALANLKVPSAASLRVYLDSIKASLMIGGELRKPTQTDQLNVL